MERFLHKGAAKSAQAMSCAPNDSAEAKLCIAEAALKRHFGHRELRPFQREAMLAWASGHDALVTLATGAGKSLCFQLPALCEPEGRWALVISPLVALMQDQVRTLQQRQIRAGLCGSGAHGETAATLRALAAGAFRIVYACPEFVLQHLEQLQALRASICLLGVDEAHCISTWGHDFRPAYRELGRIRQLFAGVPVMCVTATCAPAVAADIARCLALRPGFGRIAGRTNRPNLRYKVCERSTMEADLGELFAVKAGGAGKALGNADSRRTLPIDNTCIGPSSSTVVYVTTKARCEELAAWLELRGVLAAAYHAGLGMAARRNIHNAFIMDEVQVVVATIAFGMGIDKPSIRRVVHYGAVRTLELYVQQCGRAGRDGEDAECIAFVRPAQDAVEARALILQDFERGPASKEHCEHMLALNAKMTAYLQDCDQCRRVRLLEHFGEAPLQWAGAEPPPRGECAVVAPGGPARCGWCDACLSPSAGRGLASDFTRECRILLGCVDASRGSCGASTVCHLAAGRKLASLKHLEGHPAFGSGRHRTLEWWKAFLPQARSAKLLEEQARTLSSGRPYVAISVSPKGRHFLQAPSESFVLSPTPKDLRDPEPAPRAMPQPARARATAGGDAAEPGAGGPEPKGVVRSSGVPTATPEELYRRLLHARLQWQRKMSVLGESLVSNAALRNFSKVRPSTTAFARQHVEGLPDAISDDPLLELVHETRQFCLEHGLQMDTASLESADGFPAKRASEGCDPSPKRAKPQTSPPILAAAPGSFDGSAVHEPRVGGKVGNPELPARPIAALQFAEYCYSPGSSAHPPERTGQRVDSGPTSAMPATHVERPTAWIAAQRCPARPLAIARSTSAERPRLGIFLSASSPTSGRNQGKNS